VDIRRGYTRVQNTTRAIAVVGSRGVERLTALEVATIHCDVNAKVIRWGLVDSRIVVRTLCVVNIGMAPPIAIF
jgi:hypothetical protein